MHSGKIKQVYFSYQAAMPKSCPTFRVLDLSLNQLYPPKQVVFKIHDLWFFVKSCLVVICGCKVTAMYMLVT